MPEQAGKRTINGDSGALLARERSCPNWTAPFGAICRSPNRQCTGAGARYPFSSPLSQLRIGFAAPHLIPI